MSSRNKGTGKRSSQNQTSNGHEEKRLKNGHDQNGHSQNTSSSVQFKFSQILINQKENLSSTYKVSIFNTGNLLVRFKNERLDNRVK